MTIMALIRMETLSSMQPEEIKYFTLLIPADLLPAMNLTLAMKVSRIILVSSNILTAEFYIPSVTTRIEGGCNQLATLRFLPQNPDGMYAYAIVR